MRIFTFFLSLVLALPAMADWQLNNEKSQFNFISTKKNSVAEVHKFKKLTGSINKQGAINFEIDLSSVDSKIDIRNERMKEYLFEVIKYAKASFTGKIDLAVLNKLKLGQSTSIPLTGKLSLHGEQQVITTNVKVIKLAKKELLVVSEEPIIVNAENFKMVEGVLKLQALAGLPSISTAVPISFLLTFHE